jgi:hypothetical protein
MRTTLVLDDDLVALARDITGVLPPRKNIPPTFGL